MSPLGLDVPQLGVFTQSTLSLTSCQYVWAYVDLFTRTARCPAQALGEVTAGRCESVTASPHRADPQLCADDPRELAPSTALKIMSAG